MTLFTLCVHREAKPHGVLQMLEAGAWDYQEKCPGGHPATEEELKAALKALWEAKEPRRAEQ